MLAVALFFVSEGCARVKLIDKAINNYQRVSNAGSTLALPKGCERMRESRKVQ